MRTTARLSVAAHAKVAHAVWEASTWAVAQETTSVPVSERSRPHGGYACPGSSHRESLGLCVWAAGRSGASRTEGATRAFWDQTLLHRWLGSVQAPFGPR